MVIENSVISLGYPQNITNLTFHCVNKKKKKKKKKKKSKKKSVHNCNTQMDLKTEKSKIVSYLMEEQRKFAYRLKSM